jgi:prepilin peptidase CpaA
MLALSFLIAFPALVIAAALSDLFTMTIPNRITLLLVGGFAMAALVVGYPVEQVLSSLAGALIVLTAGFIAFAFGWVGGGDAKLAAAVSLWLGLHHVFEYLLLATVGGGMLTIALLSMRSIPLPAFALGWTWLTRLHDPKAGVPYGIALAGAALVIYPNTALWHAFF